MLQFTFLQEAVRTGNSLLPAPIGPLPSPLRFTRFSPARCRRPNSPARHSLVDRGGRQVGGNSPFFVDGMLFEMKSAGYRPLRRGDHRLAMVGSGREGPVRRLQTAAVMSRSSSFRKSDCRCFLRVKRVGLFRKRTAYFDPTSF